MTWEETIKYIRTQPEYKELVRFAYFEEDLQLNVERFSKDEEFSETKKLIASVMPINTGLRLLDIGSGNGITSIAFAQEGIQVDAVEPDPSDTIGAGAIRKLKEIYQLSNLAVHEAFAEELKFPDNSFDIVYSRQCMHHASNLQQFIKECYRVVKKGGLLITVRDHVVLDETDKKWFLESHPLQKFYGGENAFTADEYKSAMVNAGFTIKQELKHFDSIINYFPTKKTEKETRTAEFENFVNSLIVKKTGIFIRFRMVRDLAEKFVKRKLIHPYDEKRVPGRMYTFLAIK
jgi:ubiquinone/menaquinone biosynthesis C-methylase UbiE